MRRRSLRQDFGLKCEKETRPSQGIVHCSEIFGAKFLELTSEIPQLSGSWPSRYCRVIAFLKFRSRVYLANDNMYPDTCGQMFNNTRTLGDDSDRKAAVAYT